MNTIELIIYIKDDFPKSSLPNNSSLSLKKVPNDIDIAMVKKTFSCLVFRPLLSWSCYAENIFL